MAKSIPTFEALFDGFKASDSFFSDQVQALSISITTGGTIDPVTGVVTGGTATTYSADGFVRDVQDKEFNEIEAGDLVFTCKQSDLGYEPKVGDRAVILSGTMQVIQVKKKGFVVYQIQLRG